MSISYLLKGSPSSSSGPVLFPSPLSSVDAASCMQLCIPKQKKHQHHFMAYCDNYGQISSNNNHRPWKMTMTIIRCCHKDNGNNMEPSYPNSSNNNRAAASASNTVHHHNNLNKREVLTHGRACKPMRVSDVVLQTDHDDLQQQLHPTTTNTMLKLFDTKVPLDHDENSTDHLIGQFPCDLKALQEIDNRAGRIRSTLRSMEKGEITVSPYDTAWVALVREVDHHHHYSETKKPQFPSSLEWIANNQLSDGSWGERDTFQAHDRLINTLACLIALRSWDLYPDKCEKAMDFIRKNLRKLGDEEEEHMLIGFEMAFPSLIEMARGLGLEIQAEKEDESRKAVDDIYAKREIKLSRIPQGIMHNRATTLLHSLEGFSASRLLDWEKLLKLQSKDGSFLFSPSSTAFALINTKNVYCLRYLKNVVHKFNGGVPNVYPIDLFERIWVVDRLQRLGICRFFKSEIQQSMDYVYRHWSEKGICWASNSEVQDIDDTAMGFRLLRLHGYQVSPDVFDNFKKDGEFFCFVGQSSQAITGVYNLLRASQLQFPGETILEEARMFAYNYLSEKRASNQLLDKWVITKDLPGEVGYALDMPWFASLPRIESRFYIEQYGGDEDVWIGKTLYRVPNVNNNDYLELAKLDYNNCQTVHNREWDSITRWYTDHNLKEYGLSRRALLRSYFVAAASIFEPEKSNERLAWTKTSAMVHLISSYFSNERATVEERKGFTNEFLQSYGGKSYVGIRREGPVDPLIDTLNQLSLDALITHGNDIRNILGKAWEKWLLTWQEEGDRYKGEAELVAVSILLCSSLENSRIIEENEEQLNKEMKNGNYYLNPTLHSILECTNQVCYLLSPLLVENQGWCNNDEDDDHDYDYFDVTNDINIPTDVMELQMHKLVELALLKTSYSLHSSIRRVFLAIAKSFYYSAYCSPSMVDYHITKVLFQKVD